MLKLHLATGSKVGPDLHLSVGRGLYVRFGCLLYRESGMVNQD